MTSTNAQLKVFSVFSGIGALDYGLELAGMQIAGQCEIEEFPRRVLAKHWPKVARWKDVKTIKGAEILARCGTIDVVAGGVPCQPASVAGQRKGTDDDRWLWPDFLRVVSEVRPLWVLAENPRGVLSVPVAGTRFLDWLTSEFQRLGYQLLPVVASAESVGAPHRRERIWFVGHALRGRFAISQSRQSGQVATAGRAELADTSIFRRDEYQANSRSVGESQNQGRLLEPAGERNGLADSDCQRQSQSQGLESDEWRRAEYGGQGVGMANPYGTGSQEHSRQPDHNGAQQPSFIGSGWGWPARPGEQQFRWEEPRVISLRQLAAQSPLGDAIDGTSRRLARWRNAGLKGAGNAVVWQVVEQIGRAIIAIDNQLQTA